jgi:hypothetical protein
MAILDNAGERLPHFFQMRRSTIQPAQRCVCVRDRRGDGLVYLMGYRCGELSCDAVRARQCGVLGGEALLARPKCLSRPAGAHE